MNVQSPFVAPVTLLLMLTSAARVLDQAPGYTNGAVGGEVADELPVLAPPPSADSNPWNLTLFAGRHDDSTFIDILGLEGGEFEHSYIGGVALGIPLNDAQANLVWELEGSAYTHWGLQDHSEFNLAVLARWTRFPWNRWLDTSVALGQGMSFASERPEIEGDTRRLMHHLVAEIELMPLARHPVGLVLRAHHRSGAFGLYGIKAGSNFVTLGLRFHL